MKKRHKKVLLSGLLMSLMIFLSGCMQYDQQGNPEGFIYEYLVIPTQQFIVWLAELFGGNYGLAIIAITIIVRLIILPLSLNQQKKSTIQQAKMSTVKPVTDEIQAEIKATDSQEEQQELQAELMEIYRENNINLMGGLGCLPLLIQLPIFTALFQAINLSEEIASATFLGISLGDSSILLAILAGGVYYLQSLVMMKGMPEEQRKQSRMMTLMSPLMILFFSLSGPAGLSLYWLAGGIIAVIQTYITNRYVKPRIEAEVKEKQGPKKIERKRKKKPATTISTPSSTKKTNRSQSPFDTKSGQGRNAGKQQRRKR